MNLSYSLSLTRSGGVETIRIKSLIARKKRVGVVKVPRTREWNVFPSDGKASRPVGASLGKPRESWFLI